MNLGIFTSIKSCEFIKYAESASVTTGIIKNVKFEKTWISNELFDILDKIEDYKELKEDLKMIFETVLKH
jgi:hypothetical protein